jgi:hypothetical protein
VLFDAELDGSTALSNVDLATFTWEIKNRDKIFYFYFLSYAEMEEVHTVYE